MRQNANHTEIVRERNEISRELAALARNPHTRVEATDLPDPEEVERAPRPYDADDPESAQDVGSDLDGFVIPRQSGGWDGPDD